MQYFWISIGVNWYKHILSIIYLQSAKFSKISFLIISNSSESIADKFGFITVVDGIAVGHISWDPRNKPNEVTIGHNCILSSFKGRGYGKLQLEEAINRIKEYDIKKIVVTTNEILLPAQKNYESVGFIKVAERKNTETPFAGNYIDYEMTIKQ